MGRSFSPLDSLPFLIAILLKNCYFLKNVTVSILHIKLLKVNNKTYKKQTWLFKNYGILHFS